LVSRLTGAFSKAGGKLTLIQTGPFGDDGHLLFGADGTAVWAPIVDRFLKSNGLVFRDTLIAAPPRPSQAR
jgi:hypothetical protein